MSGPRVAMVRKPIAIVHAIVAGADHDVVERGDSGDHSASVRREREARAPAASVWP